MSQEKLFRFFRDQFRSSAKTDPQSKRTYWWYSSYDKSLNNIRVNSALISMELNCCGYFKIQGFLGINSHPPYPLKGGISDSPTIILGIFNSKGWSMNTG